MHFCIYRAFLILAFVLTAVFVAGTADASGLERQGGDVVKSQQNIAGTSYALGLLPKPVTVSEAVWKPGS